MASESRLFVISSETKTELRKFRLGTSRSNDMQAHIYQIDKSSLEIKRAVRADLTDGDAPYTSLRDLGDGLPDNAPRYVLLSYPLNLSSGRTKVPYVMLFYMPATTNSELRMLYAGAKEVIRNAAEVQAVFELQSEEELDTLPDRLKGTDD